MCFVELEDLLAKADVVSLHVKLTPDSHHLIGAGELAAMKEGALLLNGARGDVLDIDALCTSLNSGYLGGAGLDVFPQEPLPVDHPILDCEQVVLTPHAADQTPEGVDLLNGDTKLLFICPCLCIFKAVVGFIFLAFAQHYYCALLHLFHEVIG